MKAIFGFLQRKLIKFLEDPQLSSVEFLRKEVSFNWAIGSFVSIIILTILAYILGAAIIGHYGLTLIILYLFQLPQYRNQKYEKYQFAFLAAIILITFIFIILFLSGCSYVQLATPEMTLSYYRFLNQEIKGFKIENSTGEMKASLAEQKSKNDEAFIKMQGNIEKLLEMVKKISGM